MRLREIFRLLAKCSTYLNTNNFKRACLYIKTGNFKTLCANAINILNIEQERLKNSSDERLKQVLRNFFPPAPNQLSVEKPVDILISVYNGIEFLPRLFTSIFKNTSLPYRIIVVDDCSTDRGVRMFLEKIKEEHKNIFLITNKENLGFVKSINKASRYIQNHFVILNSDIEVPKQWLERLMYPIFKLKKIASTTPLTNAGGICSFPTSLEDNPLFEGIDIDTLDGYFQRVTPADYLELPSGIGFCMGVNKDVMEKIGMFDEETFGMGYGEENDWCMRAGKLGYRNVIVPNLFIYHKHGGSFGKEEKKKLQEINLAKLFKLHPQYPILVNDFIFRDPLKGIRNFLIVLILSEHFKNKPSLIVDHELGGGANQYRKQLIENKIKNGGAFLLTYNFHADIYRLVFYHKNYRISYTLDTFSDILELFKFIHVKELIINNLVSFKKPMDALRTIITAKTYGMDIKLMVHDYFMVCPNYNLLNRSERYCKVPDLEECSQCIKYGNGEYKSFCDYTDIPGWRNIWGEILNASDVIVCFSEVSKAIIKKAYPYIEANKITVIPHTVDYVRPVIIDSTNAKSLNVGVLGAINTVKGLKVVKGIVELIKRKNLPMKVIVIGTISEKSIGDLIVTGKYDRNEVPSLAEKYKIDIFFIPSIWPETFSYTTEEVIRMDLPVAVFDIGAQAERVRNYKKGLLLERTDPDYVAEMILEFSSRMG